MSSPEQCKAWRARLKAAGKCTECAGPVGVGGVRCLVCRERIRGEANRMNRLIKMETITAYGGRCSGVRTTGQCTESDIDILEIDHINGGGNRQREETGMRGVNFYRSLRRDGWPVGYRVLCRNCNWLAHLKRLVR